MMYVHLKWYAREEQALVIALLRHEQLHRTGIDLGTFATPTFF